MGIVKRTVKIHKITEDLPLPNMNCEGKIGTLLLDPQIGKRAMMRLPTDNGPVGFLSTIIQDVIKDNTWITIETLGGIIILEVEKLGEEDSADI